MTKHKWILNEFGDIETFDGSDWPYHSGPMCEVCYESWCVHCEPNRSLDEECDGDEEMFIFNEVNSANGQI